MSRSTRARRPRARTAVLAAALLVSGIGLAPSSTAAPVVGIDQLDITPNWRAVPRQETVTAAGPTGYVHETEDPDRSYGGEAEWTDFTDPTKSVPLGYSVAIPSFAWSGTGGRYLYVRPLGVNAVRDLETGTERQFTVPQDASYEGLLGDTLLFRQYDSAEALRTTTGYSLVRADDPDGARTPVTGWPEGAHVDEARLVAGDGSTAVIRFGRGPEWSIGLPYTDLGVVDLSTGQMTVVPAVTPYGTPPTAPVVLTADRLAWVDADRTVHLRDRADPTGPERTLPLPEGIGTSRIGLVGDWVLAVGDASGAGSALRRRLVALHPDGRVQPLLEKAEGELTQIEGGGVAVVGGSSSADWSLLKAVPGKGDGAPVLEKLRRIEPVPATVSSLALGAGRLSTLEPDTAEGRGLYARTLPVGPLHTGDPQPVWAGAEQAYLPGPTPLFDTGDGRTVYVTDAAYRKYVVARRSSGAEVRIPTGRNEGRIADAFGRWAVFQTGRTSAPGQVITSSDMLVLDLDAGTTVLTRPQTAAALWGDTLYAATAVNGEVTRTDLATGKELAKVSTGATCPTTELQVSGPWLYWACSQFLQQGVVDLRSGRKIGLEKGFTSGPLLGDGYLVDRPTTTEYGYSLRIVDFHTGTAAPARPLVEDMTLFGDRRVAWTVDRFGGAVAYKDGGDRVHAVWTGVPASDLTAASAKVPAGTRVKDGWKASWALSKPASIWQLTLRDVYTGAVIRSYGGGETRGRVDVSWDGRTTAGKPVVNGRYSWHLAASTADGQGKDLSLTGTVSVTGGRPAWRDLAGNDTQGDLLVMDTAGLVSMYKGNGYGGFSARIAGTGTKFATSSVLVPFGDVNADGCADVLVRVGDQLRAYRPGCDKVVSASSPYTLVGSGWGQYDVITSPGDANGDGYTDLVVRQASTGDMYFYAGTADHRLKTRVRIGTNWKLYKKIVGAGDLNGDGRGDLLGMDASGVLWRYHSTATGGVTARVKVGGGWGVYSSLVGTGDISGDGCADLVARDTTGRLYAYDGTCTGSYGSRRLVGSGWNTFKSLF